MITDPKLHRGIAAYDLKDHYAVLGVPLDAPSGQIRSRYLEIAKCLHPDVCKFANREKALEYLAKLVNPSYNLLNQEQERTEYEAILRLLAKRLMRRKVSIAPSCPTAQRLLLEPSTDNYLHGVQEIARAQFTDLDRIPERTDHLSQLNLVYVLTQEGYQSAPPSGVMDQAEQFIADKQWTMALRELRSLIQAEPANSKAHALLGLVYMHQKLNGMAKISFQQALKYDPQEPIALANIAKVTQTPPEKDKTHRHGFFGWLSNG